MAKIMLCKEQRWKTVSVHMHVYAFYLL